jgi:CHAT domain-containing protein/Flp pilus assembly protein TadD
MTYAWRRRLVPLGIALTLGAVAVIGALSAERPVEAYVGMPETYRAYWQWVSASVEEPEMALPSGLTRVEEDPEFSWQYTRLADLCVSQQAQARCEATLTGVKPVTPEAQQYRQAALAIVAASPEAALAAWGRLAEMPHLDPALVRRLVEADGKSGALALPARFEARLSQDTTDAGAAFGLALHLLAHGDFVGAEAMLSTARRHAHDAPDVYRELGRIYFMTGQVQKQEDVLREGVSRAEANHSFESALLLRGNLGLALIQREDGLNEAETVFREAARKWALLGDRARVGLSQYRLGLIEMRRQRYDDALAYADSALVHYRATESPSMADGLSLRGSAQLALFRFSEATASLSEAVRVAREARNTFAELQAVIALSQVHAWTGHYDQVRQEGLAALETASAAGLADIEIGLRTVLGEAERFSGNLDQARLQYSAALTLAQQLGQQAQEVKLYQRLGEVMLEMQDPAEARSYFEKAAERAADDPRVLEGLGRTYYQFGNYAQALHYYDQSIQLSAQADAVLRTNLAVHKGWALIQDRRYTEAARVLDAAMRTASKTPSVQRLSLLMTRASVANDLQQYDQALSLVSQARQVQQEVEVPSIDWILDVTAALGYWRSGKLREAEAHYRRSISTIESLRENLYSVQKRALFVGDKTQVYKQFVAFLMEQGRQSDAFYFAERARARSLADLLVTMRLGTARPGTPAAEYIQQQQRLSALQQEIVAPAEIGEADATRSASLHRELMRASQDFRQARRALASDRTFAQIATGATEASTRALLKPGEALVVFSLGLGEQAGAATGIPTIAYVFTPERVQSVRLQVNPEELTEAVRFLRDGISRSGQGAGQGWEGVARRLHADLMVPVLNALPRDVQHLHLVPEGMLHYVPFAALLDRQGRFLVERYSLSVAPSASVLAMARQRGQEVGGRWRQVIAVADPTGRLPGTRAEVAAIEALPGIRMTKLVGTQATRANLEAVSASADILHLATHGRFVSRSPWSSYLELSGDPLHVGDIEALGLDRPYLVTLSACETALGGGFTSDVPAGDEWVGLNQAFLAAGAPSVLASLWAIDDRASGRFMADFYRNLLEGRGKAWALAQTQKQYLRNPTLRHPFYWAAFTLTGEPL